MKIISHRGMWKSIKQKNSDKSLLLAIKNKYGIETDIRDSFGDIYISHDPIKINTFTKLNNFLKKISSNEMILLNVKSDGIISKSIKILEKNNCKNFLFFDMSLPEMYKAFKETDNILLHISDKFNITYDEKILKQAKGYWVDTFENECWFNPKYINILLKEKLVFIVSSELHGRDHIKQWKFIKNELDYRHDNIYICTDKPEEADLFFNGD